jgi:hypothetical protein
MHVHRRRARRAVSGLAVLGAILAAAPSAGATLSRHAPRHGFGHGTSTNWSGYAVGGTGATNVIGTWTEPAVRCAAGENSWSAPWVGIDGDTSNTVEQIGTDSDCQNGTPVYYAWWEMYPKRSILIPMTVSPGDSMTGQVTYQPSAGFVLTLTDDTTGATFTTTQALKKAMRTSVEWIMEGPSSGLLSNFGSVPFSSASATINGQTGSLGSFTTATPITMVSQQGAVRAAPSKASGGSFSVTWEHA